MRRYLLVGRGAIGIPVNPAVIRWALERSGRAGAIRRKTKGIDQWISGEARPTLVQLKALAKRSYTPLGYFFLDDPPKDELPIPYFRTELETPERPLSTGLVETVKTIEVRQAWMREYLVDLGRDPLPFVGSVRFGAVSHLELADRIRRVLGLGVGWAQGCDTWSEAFALMCRRAEEHGIVIAISGIVGNNTNRKLDPAEFRGFVLVDEFVPFLFINRADFQAAQMFTLAHELAHVWIGRSAAFDLRGLHAARDAVEEYCNRAAAEILVPEGELRPAWARVFRSPVRFQALARQFKVSAVVIARKALDLALIDRNEFFQFYGEQTVARPRSSAGGDFYRTQPVRLGRPFAETVVRAVGEGKLLYRDAYRLTGLRGVTFDRLAEAILRQQ